MRTDVQSGSGSVERDLEEVARQRPYTRFSGWSHAGDGATECDPLMNRYFRVIGIIWMIVTSELGASCWAQSQTSDDSDIDRLPRAALAPPVSAPEVRALSSTTLLEEASEYLSNRGEFLVPIPGGAGPEWVNRLFLDGRGQWTVSKALIFVYSARAEFYLQDQGPFPAMQSTGLTTFNYQFREGYVSWSESPMRLWFLDVGRINVRNGVAYGFNPTDFFRTQAVVDETSQDPADLRNDRLGTVMARGQYFFGHTTLTAIFAPRLYDAALSLDEPISELDPQIRRTNADDREEMAVSHQLPFGISSQILAYHEGTRWTYGANLASGVGQGATAYVEWSGSRRFSLPVEAMSYAVSTGTFQSAESPIPTAGAQRFTQDLATGMSYTNRENVNFVAEYDLSQLGLSSGQWAQWFEAGDGALQDEKLWYLRQYASVQQEPLDRQSVFLRVAKDNLLTRNLSASAFCVIDAGNGSSLSQVEIDYGFSNSLGISVMAQAARGSRRTNFGSVPVGGAYFVKLDWYPR